jgi:hypothetical protein
MCMNVHVVSFSPIDNFFLIKTFPEITSQLHRSEARNSRKGKKLHFEVPLIQLLPKLRDQCRKRRSELCTAISEH